MKALRLVLCITLAALSAGAAIAADDADTWAAPAPGGAGVSDKLSRARGLIAKREWADALAELRRVNDTRSADWNNLMGYALRKQSSPDLDAAGRYYDQALRINPHHFGALEYSGELMLMNRDLRNAEQNLQRLGNACELACDEYRQLRAAIERYKAAGNRYVALP